MPNKYKNKRKKICYRNDYERRSQDEEMNSILEVLEMWINEDFNHLAVRIIVYDQHKPSISNNIMIEYSGNNKLLFTINQEPSAPLKIINYSFRREIKYNLNLYEVLERAEKLAKYKHDGHKNLHVALNIFRFCLRIESCEKIYNIRDEVTSLTPLTVLIKSQNWDLVLKRIHNYPQEIKLYSPIHLHLAAAYDAPQNIVANIINVEDSARVRDRDGSIALHIACQNNASFEILQLLVKVYPKGTKVKNKEGKIPMDYVDSTSMSKRAIELLTTTHVATVTKIVSGVRSWRRTLHKEKPND